MRLGIYFSPLSGTIAPTGVGRHILGMSGALRYVRDVTPVLLASRRAYVSLITQLREELTKLPVRFLPGPEWLLRDLLVFTQLISLDQWSEDMDWIYCPKEQPVNVKKPRLAVTVHDVLPFESSVRGYISKKGFSYQLRWKWVTAQIIRRADVIAVVSEFTKQRFVEFFQVPEERIVVVGNGVSSVFFGPLEEDWHEVLKRHGVEGGRYVVFSGGFQSRKGADVVIELARLWQKQKSDLVVIVTGRRHEARYRPLVQSIANKSNSLPLRLAGYVSDKELLVLLRHSIALVLPSRYEGFGLPAVEAMAAGTPVIYSPRGALPEVIGEAGISVPCDSPAELDEVIQLLSESEELRGRLVKSGKTRAQGFTWQQCALRLVAALKERS